MKVVILAGGMGTRISEETSVKPKPMIEIGEKPILWHIMKSYAHYGYNDFVICLGYKGYQIKEYFANYYLHESEVTFDFKKGNDCTTHSNTAESWKVTLVNTGLNTMTGGRVKRIQKHIGNEPFMLTYGDGVADVNIRKLVDFHKAKEKVVTVTAVQPKARFGSLLLEGDKVKGFLEKPKGDNLWVNGGFFVVQPEIFDLLSGDDTILEKAPLKELAKKNEMAAYKHDGFWYPMDTLRDKTYLENLWQTGKAPWKVWKQ